MSAEDGSYTAVLRPYPQNADDGPGSPPPATKDEWCCFAQHPWYHDLCDFANPSPHALAAPQRVDINDFPGPWDSGAVSGGLDVSFAFLGGAAALAASVAAAASSFFLLQNASSRSLFFSSLRLTTRLTTTASAQEGEAELLPGAAPLPLQTECCGRRSGGGRPSQVSSPSCTLPGDKKESLGVEDKNRTLRTCPKANIDIMKSCTAPMPLGVTLNVASEPTTSSLVTALISLFEAKMRLSSPATGSRYG